MVSALLDMLDRLRVPAGAQPLLFSAAILRRRKLWRDQVDPDLVATLFNKRLSQAYVRQHGIATPEKLGELPTIDALPELAELPPRFVLKPVRGSSNHGVFLFENGLNVFDGKLYTRQQVIDAVKAAPLLAPGVPFLMEEFLQNWDGKPGAPNDFKFYNFGAATAFIHVIERNSGRKASLNRHWFLKPDWTPLGLTIQPTQIHSADPPPIPPCAADMLALSQRLSAGIGMFIRIDLYATTRGPVFGEFTLNPHGGKGYTPEADRWLGTLWRGDLGVSPPLLRVAG